MLEAVKYYWAKKKKLEEGKKFFRSYKFKVVTILNMVKYDGHSKKAVIPSLWELLILQILPQIHIHWHHSFSEMFLYFKS